MPNRAIPADLQKIFDDFLDPETDVHRKAAKDLQGNLSRALPHIPRLFRDARYWKQYEGYFAWPIDELLQALAPTAPIELVSALGELLDSADYWGRSKIGFGLGSFGREECISYLQRCLRDPDSHVRSMTISGLNYGGKKKHCSRHFRKAMFGELMLLMEKPASGGDTDGVFAALLSLDQLRARKLFLAKPYWDAAHPGIYRILEVFKRREIIVPEPKLLELLECFGQQQTFVASWAYGEALLAFAKTGNSKAFDLISRALFFDLGTDEYFSNPGFREAVEALGLLSDKRVGPFLLRKKLAERTTHGAFLAVNDVLRQRRKRKDISAARSNARWENGREIQRNGTVVRMIVREPGTTGSQPPISEGTWDFKDEGDARRMFEYLDETAYRVKKSRGKVTKVVFYPWTMESGEDYFDFDGQVSSGPTLELSDKYLH